MESIKSIEPIKSYPVKENWICFACKFSNWAKRSVCNKCNSLKRMSECISEDEWNKIKIKEEYSSQINDVSKWKFNKLDGKNIEQVTTLYEKIAVAQQIKYIEYAKTDPNLKLTLELGIVPASVLLYIKNIFDINCKENLHNLESKADKIKADKIKEDILNEFVKKLWIYHEVLFLETVDFNDANNVKQMVKYVKNIDKYEGEYFKKRYGNECNYGQSYEKVTAIIMKQFENQV